MFIVGIGSYLFGSLVFAFEDVVYKIYEKVGRHPPQVEWTKWRVGKVN